MKELSESKNLTPLVLVFTIVDMGLSPPPPPLLPFWHPLLLLGNLQNLKIGSQYHYNTLFYTSGQNLWKIPVKNSSFSKVARCNPITALKRDSCMSAFSTFLITNIEQLHCRAAFSKHLFFRRPSTFQLLLLGCHNYIN